MATIPLLLLLIGVTHSIYIQKYRDRPDTAVSKPDPTELCTIELYNCYHGKAVPAKAEPEKMLAITMEQPSSKFGFRSSRHVAIEWMMNPLSRERHRGRKIKFTAAPRDESEAPNAEPERLRINVQREDDEDRLDFATEENVTSVVTSVESPMYRTWTMDGGRRFVQGGFHRGFPAQNDLASQANLNTLENVSEQNVRDSMDV